MMYQTKARAWRQKAAQALKGIVRTASSLSRCHSALFINRKIVQYRFILVCITLGIFLQKLSTSNKTDLMNKVILNLGNQYIGI